jgi:branched-chain amino acid transport system substrate-binding protein
MEEVDYDLLSGKLKWTNAAEGHFPQKSAAVLEVQAGKPAFIKWVPPESVPQP